MTLTQNSWTRELKDKITAGSVLGAIYNDSPAITVSNIARYIGADILDRGEYKKIVSILDDLEQNYEIANTPYGYVRMNDSVSCSMQLSWHFYRERKRPHKTFDFCQYIDNIVEKNQYFWLPNIENSRLPEGVIVYKKKYTYSTAYITHIYEHEYAYQKPGEPVQVCDHWYYGWYSS